MPTAFAKIAFTPSVKAAQSRYGSRAMNRGFELADDAGDTLTATEQQFIGQRDHFYQATVAENGWPYVQHRGGPAGFVKVLDARHIAFADFGGNRQYLSVGNLAANDRIALIMMDYARRQRLKLWGRARIVHADDDAALMERVSVDGYRARVERTIVIEIEAFSWNCPQHIVQRYTKAEIQAVVDPLLEEIAVLKQRLRDLSSKTTPPGKSLAEG